MMTYAQKDNEKDIKLVASLLLLTKKYKQDNGPLQRLLEHYVPRWTVERHLLLVVFVFDKRGPFTFVIDHMKRDHVFIGCTSVIVGSRIVC